MVSTVPYMSRLHPWKHLHCVNGQQNRHSKGRAEGSPQVLWFCSCANQWSHPLFLILILKEREKHQFVVPSTDAFIGWFLYVPWLGIKPTPLVYQADILTDWAMGPGWDTSSWRPPPIVSVEIAKSAISAKFSEYPCHVWEEPSCLRACFWGGHASSLGLRCKYYPAWEWKGACFSRGLLPPSPAAEPKGLCGHFHPLTHTFAGESHCGLPSHFGSLLPQRLEHTPRVLWQLCGRFLYFSAI